MSVAVASRRAVKDEPVDLGPDNIFAELGLPDPEERLLKATLVSRVRAVIADRRLSQREAGRIMGLPQPKVSELVSGGASGFGAERLLHLLNKLGVSVSIAFQEEPAYVAGETTFLWDRDRDVSEEIADQAEAEADEEAEPASAFAM